MSACYGKAFFAEEITPDHAELDLFITYIIDNIRSAPVPEEALQ